MGEKLHNIISFPYLTFNINELVKHPGVSSSTWSSQVRLQGSTAVKLLSNNQTEEMWKPTRISESLH